LGAKRKKEKKMVREKAVACRKDMFLDFDEVLNYEAVR
tara:strand:- start:485 stop:598 length:114 start_codon:yes stop_codon:yes gene_type:complete